MPSPNFHRVSMKVNARLVGALREKNYQVQTVEASHVNKNYTTSWLNKVSKAGLYKSHLLNSFRILN